MNSVSEKRLEARDGVYSYLNANSESRESEDLLRSLLVMSPNFADIANRLRQYNERTNVPATPISHSERSDHAKRERCQNL